MPIPPALCAFLLLSAQVACHDGPIDTDVAQHLVNLLLEATATMLAPPDTQALPLPVKAQCPVVVKLHWNDSSIVRPVFEQRPLGLEQVRQLTLLIRQVAREQDHVMCPRQGVDTVDLHKAQMRDQLEQSSSRQFS